MGLCRLVLISFFILCSQRALASVSTKNPRPEILNVSATQGVKEALKVYLHYYQNIENQDFSLLRILGEQILEQGISSSDTKIQNATIFGASIAGSSEGLDILKRGLDNPDPFMQLIVLGALQNYVGRTVHDLLFKAMSSPYPVIRLEAAYKLALLNHADVIDHLSSFIHKLPLELKPLAAAIYLLLDTEESNTYIKELLSSPHPATRASTTLLIGEYKKSQFLSSLRSLSTAALLPIEKEALLFALGNLQDSTSHPFFLRTFSTASNATNKLYAAVALAKIGQENIVIPFLSQEIQNNNPFAVSACSYLHKTEAEKLLTPLLLSQQSPEEYKNKGFSSTQEEIMRLNAAFVLAKMGCHSKALQQYLIAFFSSPEAPKKLSVTFSPGKTLAALTWTSLTSTKNYPEEDLIRAVFSLPKENYRPILEALLSSEDQSDHLKIQALTLLSENKAPLFLPILFSTAQTPGKPLIRALSNLAIFKITGDPKQKALLHDWLLKASSNVLFLIDQENPTPKASSSCLKFEVIPELRTKILLQILETLVASKNKEDILLLVRLIIEGNSKNLYPLAGLLIKISE